MSRQLPHTCDTGLNFTARFNYIIFVDMARKAIIPDTDTEEVAGLLNEHALRSGSGPESKRRGRHPISSKAGTLGKTRNADAQRGPNGNVANKAVKRAPEHGRQLRSATRSMEPQAAPGRKRKRDVYDIDNCIEEEAEEQDERKGHEGSSLRAAIPKKQTARPSKKMKSHGAAKAAEGRERGPQDSRARLAGPEGHSVRRSHIAIQDSEPDSEDSEGEERDTVEERTAEPETTDGFGLAAPLELDEEALKIKMLLGNEGLWKMISKASRKNRRKSQNCKELESNVMTDLVEKLKEARQVYDSLATDELTAEEIDEAEQELATGLNEICTTVDDLTKSSAGPQASKVVYEAYMNGVSQFVSLLKRAMKGRVLKSSPKAYDLDGLEEVVFIQDMLLRFLEKLSSWKICSEGFTKNVQQRIKPYLRAMLNNFKKHLTRERIAEKRRINRDITASQFVEEVVSPRVQQQRKAARLEEIQRQILRSAEEESLRWGGNLRLVEEMRDPVLHRAPSVRAAGSRSDAWTMEEDTALIHELLNNKETRQLPGMLFPSSCLFLTPSLTRSQWTSAIE